MARVHSSGFLSPSIQYELMVTSALGVPELEMLMRKLQVDIDILRDADADKMSATGNLTDKAADE